MDAATDGPFGGGHRIGEAGHPGPTVPDPVACGAGQTYAAAEHERQGLEAKRNCTMDDVENASCQVQSIDAEVFDDETVIPVVMLYAGMGGLELGG